MQISTHCYAVTGLACVPPWSVNAGIVVGRHTTLIVDTSANAHSAATIYGYATVARLQNRLLVINTEKHFDHIGGNSFFRHHSIEIIAHPGSVRTEAEFSVEKEEFNSAIPNPVRRDLHEECVFYAGTNLAAPTQFVTSPTMLDLGELQAQIIPTPGHTPTNLSVYVAGDGVLFTGDCVVTGYVPNLDSGSEPDWLAWLSSLDQIEQLSPRVIVPGHGVVIRDTDVRANLARIRMFIEDTLGSGLTPTGKKPAAHLLSDS